MRWVWISILALVASACAFSAIAQTPAPPQLLQDMATICTTPSGSLEESGAIVDALGGRFRRIDDDSYRRSVGPSFHPGAKIQSGLRRAYISAEPHGFLFEFRAGAGSFGQVVDFLVPDQDGARAYLAQRFGPPTLGTAGNGNHIEQFAAGEASILLLSLPGTAAHVVCAMPRPPVGAPLTIEQQATQVAEEAWQVCGLYADALADAEPVVGLLSGRYRRAPESMRAMLNDSAGAIVGDPQAGAEILEQNFYFRRSGDGVVVLELTEQRQREATHVIASFRLIQIDRQILVGALSRRFGPRDSAGTGPPIVSNGHSIDVATFGRHAPLEPGTRQLVALIGGETISVSCFLRKFPGAEPAQ